MEDSFVVIHLAHLSCFGLIKELGQNAFILTEALAPDQLPKVSKGDEINEDSEHMKQKQGIIT